jgi:hypothetical protein
MKSDVFRERELKMSEPWLNLPVVCPECGKEERFALPLGAVAEALLKDDAIELYVSCHDIYWNADRSEVERVRTTLREIAGVSIQRVPSPASDELPRVPAPQSALERLSADGSSIAR